MKKLTIILIISVIVAVGVFAGDVFFPTEKGMVLLTANLNSNGRLEGFTRLTVTDVAHSGNTTTVTYTMQVLDRNRRPVGSSGEREYSMNIVDGVLEYALGDMMDILFAARDMNYTLSAGTMLIPSNIAPGSSIADTWINMTVTVPILGTVTANTTITNIVCVAIETVTVPAGTFEAYKITQTSTTVVSRGRSPIVTTSEMWYARGIGLVKAINYNHRGRVESSSELREITR